MSPTPTPADVLESVRAAVLEAEPHLLELSHALSDDPELAFDEVRAAARVAAVLEDAGFTLTREAYGLPTAIEAVYGTGELTVVIACEYDALPGVGHACGHNIIAAAAVGAALGLAPLADELGLRLVLLGTPAEESGGGKILLLQRGAWDSAALSLMVHPSTAGQLPATGLVTFALEHVRVEFSGRAAHAAAAPQTGINAGDAITLTQVGLGLLRQQLPPATIVASRVVEAGVATNIIPDTGVMEIEIRGANAQEWNDVRARIRKVVEGAAIATGCTWSVEPTEVPYEPLTSDPDLADLWDGVLAEDLGYSSGSIPPGYVGGSTDMGNVSQYLPSIHPMLELKDVEATPHHADFAAAACSAAGDRAVVDGALGLAFTVAKAASLTELRARLLDLQAQRKPFATFDAER